MPKKPNILVIWGDDVGSACASFTIDAAVRELERFLGSTAG